MSESGEWGSWRQDREHKYVVGLKVTAAERLAWLEEMLELAWSRGALPKRRDRWGRPLAPGEER
jgi:hypothetical protein